MSISNVDYFLELEEQLILLEIQRDFCFEQTDMKSCSNEKLQTINSNLLLTDKSSIAYKVHSRIINSLVTFYLDSKFREYSSELEKIFPFDEVISDEIILTKHRDEIPEIIECLHINYLNSEFSLSNGKLTRRKSKHNLRESGSVYTLQQIAYEIVDTTISNSVKDGVSLKEITCLDFACGTGRFYFEAVEILRSKYNLNLEQIICTNLFAIDVDEVALTVLRCKIISKFSELNTRIIEVLSKNIICRNALMPKLELGKVSDSGLDFNTDFETVFAKGGFDVVFSNPPYYLLKVNKKSSSLKLSEYYSSLQNRIQNQIVYFRTSGFYQYSIEGMLNYYQISIEMIIRLTKVKGQIGIICPSSLFADLTSAKLRKYLLFMNRLRFIRYYSESTKLFDNVAQSTVIFYLQKGCNTDSIKIEKSNNSFEVNLSTIKNIFSTNFEIPLIDKIEWSILEKISKHKMLREIPFIRNRRGELDLTQHKSFITSENTGWRLVRGNMISDGSIFDKNGEYVNVSEFLKKKSTDYKMYDHNSERLICQQISNVDLHRRLKFVFCERTDIIGNSCNYIVSTRGQDDLKKLFYLLNSSLLNWRFKISSSNNHVNNYELDELPIVELDSFSLSNFLTEGSVIDKIVCKLYGLTEGETNYILSMQKKMKQVVEYEIV